MSEGGQGGVSPTAPQATLADILTRLDVIERQLQATAPITPLYTLQQATILLPCIHVTLMKMLQRHRVLLDPPLYRHDKRHRRYRMLSQRDLLLLRSKLTYRPGQRSRSQVLKDLAAA